MQKLTRVSCFRSASFRKSHKIAEADACRDLQVEGEIVQVITSGGFPEFNPAEVPAVLPVRSLCDFFGGKVFEVVIYI